MISPISELRLDQLGRLVLDDEQLSLIEGHIEYASAGGASNDKCTNDLGCANTTNGTCSNRDCGGSSNGHCVIGPIE